MRAVVFLINVAVVIRRLRPGGAARLEISPPSVIHPSSSATTRAVDRPTRATPSRTDVSRIFFERRVAASASRTRRRAHLSTLSSVAAGRITSTSLPSLLSRDSRHSGITLERRGRIPSVASMSSMPCASVRRWTSARRMEVREAKEATPRKDEAFVSAVRRGEFIGTILARALGDVSADVREAALMVGRAALSDVTDKTSYGEATRFSATDGRGGRNRRLTAGPHAWCRDCAVCARGAVVLR